jgi:hypothetical protein
MGVPRDPPPSGGYRPHQGRGRVRKPYAQRTRTPQKLCVYAGLRAASGVLIRCRLVTRVSVRALGGGRSSRAAVIPGVPRDPHRHGGYPLRQGRGCRVPNRRVAYQLDLRNPRKRRPTRAAGGTIYQGLYQAGSRALRPSSANLGCTYSVRARTRVGSRPGRRSADGTSAPAGGSGVAASRPAAASRVRVPGVRIPAQALGVRRVRSPRRG